MVLYRVILPVSDIEKASVFYGAVLVDAGRRVSPGRHYFGGGHDGGAILACYSPLEDGDLSRYGDSWRPHPLQYVYFSTDDLQGARERCLEAGAADVTAIEAMPWGETMFYAVDPFGNPISVVLSGTEFRG